MQSSNKKPRSKMQNDIVGYKLGWAALDWPGLGWRGCSGGRCGRSWVCIGGKALGGWLGVLGMLCLGDALKGIEILRVI